MNANRRYERVGLFRQLTLTILADGQTVPAHSFDASLGGVGLTAAVFLSRGEPVQVAFHLSDRDGQPVVECVAGMVAFCRPEQEGNIMGIEFLAPVQLDTQPELTRILQNL